MSSASGRWVVSWSASYDDVSDAYEAVRVAVGDLENAMKHLGEGADAFLVEDTVTGTVSIITMETALATPHNTTIINLNNSINYAPSVTINVEASKGKKGKKGISK